MNPENILTNSKKKQLSTLLQNGQFDDFFNALKSLAAHGELESWVLEIKEEWRKLQIAKRNGLMDDEQVHLAIKAYFKRSAQRMSEPAKAE